MFLSLISKSKSWKFNFEQPRRVVQLQYIFSRR